MDTLRKQTVFWGVSDFLWSYNTTLLGSGKTLSCQPSQHQTQLLSHFTRGTSSTPHWGGQASGDSGKAGPLFGMTWKVYVGRGSVWFWWGEDGNKDPFETWVYLNLLGRDFFDYVAYQFSIIWKCPLIWYLFFSMSCLSWNLPTLHCSKGEYVLHSIYICRKCSTIVINVI